jgi:hypothetical protein
MTYPKAMFLILAVTSSLSLLCWSIFTNNPSQHFFVMVNVFITTCVLMFIVFTQKKAKS